MCFIAYIKNGLCINLLVFYLTNGRPPSGGPHHSRAKIGTQSDRGPKPNTETPEGPPTPL